MALTIKPVSKSGRVIIEDDKSRTKGIGRAVASKSIEGYVTLTLNFHNPITNQVVVLRMPADWIQALDNLEE